ncbi:hypothetical protein E3N88_08628 [Mikania micrantha]|uniref:Uncharacterized protein n=1 Tax=Mikania micrantha TaxID=192012 RepID=A0A5N6PHC3_9ASTR|nr:hypothetical protein E3N88_08628 [Mikania micrantha]
MVLSDSDTNPSEHSDNSSDNETVATIEHSIQNQGQETHEPQPFPLGRGGGRGVWRDGIRVFDEWRSAHQQECNLVAHQAQELTYNWGELEETMLINGMGLAGVREEIRRGKKWAMAAAATTWVVMIRIATFIYILM